MEDKIFDQLSKKMSVKPSSDCDQEFWQKFEREFPVHQEPKSSFWQIPRWRFAMGGVVGAAFALALWLNPLSIEFLPKDISNLPPNLSSGAIAVSTDEAPEFFESVGQEEWQFEMMASAPVPVDVFAEFEDVEISEKDWDVLLPSKIRNGGLRDASY